MNYPGGKGAEGVYHAIINQIPPHRVYIEPFLGGGSILLHKRPAEISWAGEWHREQFEAFDPGDTFRRPQTLVGQLGPFGDGAGKRMFCDAAGTPNLWVLHTDALKFLREFMFQGNKDHYFVYCDPPYLKEMRSSSGKVYTKDFSTWFEHEELLAILAGLNANVMISGYDHPLYNGRLSGWRKATFTGVTRGGARTETIWMNYPEPVELHDYRYVGKDYREREAIRKNQRNLISKLEKMPAQRRFAILAAVQDHFANLSSLAENGGAADSVAGGSGSPEPAIDLPATIAAAGDDSDREIDPAGYLGRDLTQHPTRPSGLAINAKVETLIDLADIENAVARGYDRLHYVQREWFLTNDREMASYRVREHNKNLAAAVIKKAHKERVAALGKPLAENGDGGSPREKAITETYGGYDVSAEVAAVRGFRGIDFETFKRSAEISIGDGAWYSFRVAVDHPHHYIYDVPKLSPAKTADQAAREAYNYLQCIIAHDGKVNLHGVFHRPRGLKVWSRGKREQITFYLSRSDVRNGWFVAFDAWVEPESHGGSSYPHLNKNLMPDAATYNEAFALAVDKVAAWDEKRVTQKIIDQIYAKRDSWAPTKDGADRPPPKTTWTASASPKKARPAGSKISA